MPLKTDTGERQIVGVLSNAELPSTVVRTDVDNTLADGIDIAVGTTTGTKIGTATAQKIGFFNAAPVAQGASVADASGGATVDAEARTAINAVISRLEALGLIATV